MKKYWKLVTIILLMSFCCSACKKQASPSAPAVVTQVDVIYRTREQTLHRTYLHPDKLDAVLFYLYKLSPYGIPDINPETLQMDSCRITVQLSNGSQQVYRQRGDRYLSVDCGRWQKINPGKGAQLLYLIRILPGDLIPEAEQNPSTATETQN